MLNKLPQVPVRLVAASLALTGVIAYGSLAAPASGELYGLSAKYVTNDGCNGNQVDPITVSFKGRGATVGLVRRTIRKITNWDSDASGGQGLRMRNENNTATVCRETDSAIASACDACVIGFPPSLPPHQRYHIRLWGLKYTSNGVKWVNGTPHWEDDKDCGHAVRAGGVGHGRSGFDIARSAVIRAFYFNTNNHPYNVYNWGNTKRFYQCNEKLAGSNGQVAVFKYGELP